MAGIVFRYARPHLSEENRSIPEMPRELTGAENRTQRFPGAFAVTSWASRQGTSFRPTSLEGSPGLEVYVSGLFFRHDLGIQAHLSTEMLGKTALLVRLQEWQSRGRSKESQEIRSGLPGQPSSLVDGSGQAW